MIESITGAIGYLGQSSFWIAFLVGVGIAVVAALVPVVSAGLLMAIAVPFIVLTVDDPIIGIVMLATITGVEEMLDVIPILVLGHPGGGQVTFIEGSQLAQKGQVARALGFIYAVSALGGFIGAVLLMVLIPIIKPFVLSFSFPEITAMALFGVGLVGALSQGAMLKGIAMGLFGIMLATVGVDPFTGTVRYTFGIVEIHDGLPIIATTIGLFALPEMIDLIMTRSAVSSDNANISQREVFRGVADAFKKWHIIVRHSVFGVLLGMIPGVGSRVVSWLSYGLGIALSKDRSQFGKGSYDGLVFSESVQSSKEGGQAIPSLALGVPGGQSWIYILIAMLAYGVSPGPQMLSGRFAPLTTLIVFSLVLGNAALALVGILWSGQLAKLSRVPFPLMAAVLVPLVFLSAFQDMLHWGAIPLVLFFSVVGLLMKQYKWPRPPLILGFILGSIVERNFGTSLSLYGWDGMARRPIAWTLLILAIIATVVLTRLSARTNEAETNVVRRFQIRWSNELIFPILVIGAVAYMIIEAFTFPTRSAWFPWLIGSLTMVLVLLQLLRTFMGYGSGEVLDLGMRSEGKEGRAATAWAFVGLLALFLLLTFSVGMKWGVIAFAALGPLALMRDRRSWIWGAVTGSAVALVVFLVFDYLLAVLWPEPVLLQWITASR